MTSRDLAPLLRELHDALAAGATLEGETAALAKLVRDELDRSLADAGDLAPKLESVIERFEGQHPELVEAARRVLEQLSNVGI